MDMIVLCIMNGICKYAATIRRILFSATFGAIWSVCAIMIPRTFAVLVNICTYVLISLIMVRICAGKCSIKDIIKGVMTLYVSTFLLGGIMNWLYFNTAAGTYVNRLLKDYELILFIVISIGVVCLIYSRLIKIGIYSDKCCRVIFVLGETRIQASGYVDTGNVLVDPYMKKPISVAEKHEFDEALKSINDCTKVKYHLVPYHSLGSESGLLGVITVDTMYIYYGKSKRTIEHALIGLAEDTLSGDGEYTVLVNAQHMH